MNAQAAVREFPYKTDLCKIIGADPAYGTPEWKKADDVMTNLRSGSPEIVPNAEGKARIAKAREQLNAADARYSKALKSLLEEKAKLEAEIRKSPLGRPSLKKKLQEELEPKIKLREETLREIGYMKEDLGTYAKKGVIEFSEMDTIINTAWAFDDFKNSKPLATWREVASIRFSADEKGRSQQTVMGHMLELKDGKVLVWPTQSVVDFKSPSNPSDNFNSWVYKEGPNRVSTEPVLSVDLAVIDPVIAKGLQEQRGSMRIPAIGQPSKDPRYDTFIRRNSEGLYTIGPVAGETGRYDSNDMTELSHLLDLECDARALRQKIYKSRIPDGKVPEEVIYDPSKANAPAQKSH